MKKTVFGIVICAVLLAVAIITMFFANGVPAILPFDAMEGDEICSGEVLAEALSSVKSGGGNRYRSASIHENIIVNSNRETLKQLTDIYYTETATYQVYNGVYSLKMDGEKIDATYEFECFRSGDQYYIRFNVFNCRYSFSETVEYDVRATKAANEKKKQEILHMREEAQKQIKEEVKCIHSCLRKWIGVTFDENKTANSLYIAVKNGEFTGFSESITSYIVGCAVAASEIETFKDIAKTIDIMPEVKTETSSFKKEGGFYALTSNRESKVTLENGEEGRLEQKKEEYRFDLSDASIANMRLELEQTQFGVFQSVYDELSLFNLNHTEVNSEMIIKEDVLPCAKMFSALAKE